MFSRLKGRPSPAMLVALVALFLALGGPGYAATGGNFVLGVVNTATSSTSLSASGTTPKALAVTNTSTTSGSTALALTVPNGHQPLTVNRSTKVANLNADWLDGVDSTGFVRKGIAQSAAVDSAGVVDVTNTADGGYAVAGHVASEGAAIYGEAPGKGYAGYFDGDVHVSGNLLCASTCVNGSTVSGTVPDAARVDGASIVSNRDRQRTLVTHILELPGFGYLYVLSCDRTNASFGWVSDGTPPPRSRGTTSSARTSPCIGPHHQQPREPEPLAAVRSTSSSWRGTPAPPRRSPTSRSPSTRRRARSRARRWCNPARSSGPCPTPSPRRDGASRGAWTPSRRRRDAP